MSLMAIALVGCSNHKEEQETSDKSKAQISALNSQVATPEMQKYEEESVKGVTYAYRVVSSEYQLNHGYDDYIVNLVGMDDAEINNLKLSDIVSPDKKKRSISIWESQMPQEIVNGEIVLVTYDANNHDEIANLSMIINE